MEPEKTHLGSLTELDQIAELAREQSAIVDNLLVGICCFQGHKIKWVNSMLETMFGYEHGAMNGQSPKDLAVFHESFQPEIERAGRLLKSGQRYYGEGLARRQDGTNFWVAMAATLLDKDNPEGGSVWLARDISQHKQAENDLLLTQFVMDEAGDSIVWAKEDGIIMYSNAACVALTGYTKPELLSMHFWDLHPGMTKESFTENFSLMKEHANAISSCTSVTTKDGSQLPVELKTRVAAINGVPMTVGIIRDLSERKAIQEQLRQLAHEDPLTQLPNRTLFLEHLEHALQRAKRNKTKLALLMLDLDNFKVVNDTLGHNAGDLLLGEISMRLKASIRESDLVARLGGDEFAIIIEDLKHSEDAAYVATKIRTNLLRPVTLNNSEFFPGVSVGIAIAPDDGDESQSLMSAADAAMYSAKEQGRDNYQFFTPELNARYTRRLYLETELRKAIEAGQFSVAYQPIIDLKTGQYEEVEALLRWTAKDIGPVSPAEFIPIAEESGLIFPITEWLFKEVAHFIKNFPKTAGEPPIVSVNVSGQQFMTRESAARIRRWITELGIPPNKLAVELTETSLINHLEIAIEELNKLQEIGSTISLDDFGTGYSSLSHLRRCPINTVKIDRSFIMNICTCPDSAAIVQTIIAMALTLRLDVVAEGIETEEQMHLLKAWQCTHGQGYYFSRPVQEEQLVTFLKSAPSMLPSP